MFNVMAMRLEECGQKPVHVIKVWKREVIVAPKRLESASCIARAIAQHPTTQTVGKARGKTFGHGIAPANTLPRDKARCRPVVQKWGDKARYL